MRYDNSTLPLHPTCSICDRTHDLCIYELEQPAFNGSMKYDSNVSGPVAMHRYVLLVKEI
jgi:hypothetical protein